MQSHRPEGISDSIPGSHGQLVWLRIEGYSSGSLSLPSAAPIAPPTNTPTGPAMNPPTVAPITPTPIALAICASSRCFLLSGALVVPFQRRAVRAVTVDLSRLQQMHAARRLLP